MDYAEQLFALQVHLKVTELVNEELRHAELTQAELTELIGEHIRDILRSTDSTAKVIRSIRGGA